MGRASHRSLPRALFVLSVPVLLSACVTAYERRIAEDLYSAGELHRARRVLARLTVAGGAGPDHETLRDLDEELGTFHYRKAMTWVRQGFLEAAYHELALCLFFRPQHVPAQALARRLWEGSQRFYAWQDAYTRAVDNEQWDRALEYLVEEQDPLFEHRYWGRWRELLERAWTTYRARIDRIDRSGGAALPSEILAVVDRAERFLERHAALIEEAGYVWRDEVDTWRQHAQTLSDAARWRQIGHDACQAGQHRRATRAFERALFRFPDEQRLREEVFAQRRRWVVDLARRGKDAASNGDWMAALRAARALSLLSGGPPHLALKTLGEVAAPELVTRQLLSRGVSDLCREARAFEARGLLGNALVLITEAREANPSRVRLQADVTRLRHELRARPLVQLDSRSELATAVIERLSRIVVVPGEAHYTEERTPVFRRIESTRALEGAEWVLHPVRLAEERLLREALRKVDRLRLRRVEASGLERAHADRRYRAALKECDRIRGRLRDLPTEECRAVYQVERIEVMTGELKARLVLPVTVFTPGAEPEERELSAQLYRRDRWAPSDPRRRLPGDPNELPDKDEARRELERQIEAGLEDLVKSARVRALRALLPTAQARFHAGRILEGVELAIWAILKSTPGDHALRLRAVNLLEEWTPYLPDTLRVLSGVTRAASPAGEL